MRALNALPASHYPGAEEVGLIIEMVQGLIDRAMPTRSTATSTFGSARSRATASCRIATSTICWRVPASRSTSGEDPLDFALWKAANRASRVGSRRGVLGDPAGTSNARR